MAGRSVASNANQPPAHTLLFSMTKRTSLKLTDERQRKLDRASEIVADGTHDDPLMSDVLNVALTLLIESEQNIQGTRDELGPKTIRKFNTSVLGLWYRTRLKVGSVRRGQIRIERPTWFEVFLPVVSCYESTSNLVGPSFPSPWQV